MLDLKENRDSRERNIQNILVMNTGPRGQRNKLHLRKAFTEKQGTPLSILLFLYVKRETSTLRKRITH